MKKRKRMTQKVGFHASVPDAQVPDARVGASGDAQVSDAPDLTETDVKRFESVTQAWSCSSQEDRIKYCRERLTHYVGKQIPPLLDDILGSVFHNQKQWGPWETFDRGRDHPTTIRVVTESLETSKTLLCVEPMSGTYMQGKFIGFFRPVSILDGPRKWSCRLLTPKSLDNYIGVGVFDTNYNHQGAYDCEPMCAIYIDSDTTLWCHTVDDLQKLTDDLFITVYIELLPDLRTLRFQTMESIVDIPLTVPVTKWHPYVCLRGTMIASVQEE